MGQLITRAGDVLELEDSRELEETRLPGRMLEVLQDFAEAQRLGRKRWKPPRDGFRFFDVNSIAEANRRLYDELRGDPDRWAAYLAAHSAYVADRRRTNVEFLEKERAARARSYAKLRADPERAQAERDRARRKYAEMRSDPAQRERYERSKEAARERHRRRKQK